MKNLIFILSVVTIVSCGTKKELLSPSSMGIVDALTTRKDFQRAKGINEVTCIDEALQASLNNEERVKDVDVDTDINFCNGLRVRLKVFKMSKTQFRAFGFAQSSSGKMSCLTQNKDFKKLPILGYEGTLIGEGIKIALGGHLYTSNNELEKSSKLLGKYVKFDDVNYRGELAFFENENLKCWAIH